MFPDRKKLYADLEAKRKSRVLVYVTGDRPGAEAQIGDDIYDNLAMHLDTFGDCEKISLFLYTRGGKTLAAWTILNVILQFCKNFEVIVPSKAHSAGTLICLAAHKIVMTKQATLGPIDPSVNGHLNPTIPGVPPGLGRVPVNVEAIQGFLDFARQTAGITDQHALSQIFLELSRQVHPLVLGDAYRARSQIRMLSATLLQSRLGNVPAVQKIQEFLCSESGSHDYTINRREAQELGLTIEKPDDDLYQIIEAIYRDFSKELMFGLPFDPNVALGVNSVHDYNLRRCLLESIGSGSNVFQTVGRLERIPPDKINNLVTFEGWKHEHKKS